MAGTYHLILCLCSYYLLFVGGTAQAQLTGPYTWLQQECPEENTPMMYIQVPWGVEGRAYKTMPQGLVISPSKLPDAGFGVISETFIPKYTWLGTCDGEIVDVKNSDHISWYAWEIKRGEEITAQLDAYHLHLSSYLCYVNSPNRHRDENVIPAECYGRIYYVTNKDILPGDELLIYYGPNYTVHLGIDFNIYFDIPKEFQDGGLDLNKEDHRDTVADEGFELFQVKYLPSSWLNRFLHKMAEKKESDSQ